jgi:hypothetical protein
LSVAKRDLAIYRGINGDFHKTAPRNRMLAEMIRICHHVPMSSSRNIVAFEHRPSPPLRSSSESMKQSGARAMAGGDVDA